MRKQRPGFTLVELLVAISILAVLSVVGLISFIQVTKNSRDSKRISDMRQVQASLEQYFADQFFYPAIGTGCDNGSFKIDCPLKSPNGLKTYINPVPKDPQGSLQYLYQPSSTRTSYCLFARMEIAQNGVDLPNCSAPGYNFEATTP